MPKPALPGSHRSYGLMGQTKILLSPSVVPNAKGLRPPQADCQSLLEDGPSRRYLRIPCIGAWTPTPLRPSGASACFFPENFGLTSRFKSSARKTIPAMQLQQGSIFRGCSHSVMFRLPCLLGPPVAPTAVGFAHRAAGPFTPRNGRVVTLHELWHRYIPEPGNWYGGTFTHWNAALSAATESLRSICFITFGRIPQF